MRNHPTAAERFWGKFRRSPDGCWLWTAAVDPATGYGKFAVRSDQIANAHRWGYELLVGPVPDGLQLDHLCRVRCCVNPLHLEPVTQRENLRRGRAHRSEAA